MRVFLIDFENVHSEGMSGVDHLCEQDEVVIFYSNNADSVSFDVLHKLMFCKSKLSYYKIKRGGKNALDFQLSCYLGYRIHKDPDAEFYIISKDNGYDFLMDFWDCGYVNVEPVIRRFNNIRTLLQWTEAQKRQKERAVNSLGALAKSTTANNATNTPKSIIAKPATPARPITPATPVAPPISETQTPVHICEEEEKSAELVEEFERDATDEVEEVAEEVSEEIAENNTEEIEEETEVAPFVPTDAETEIAFTLMPQSKNSHGLYINMVKRFGQKKGREMYGHFKGEYQRRRKEGEYN